VLFLASVLVPFAMMAIGFRLFYDSVIPEVAGLVLTGAVLAYFRPTFVPLWLVGIAIGIILSERVFPATPPAEHVLRYGPPQPVTFVDLLKLSVFPLAGSVLGAAARGISRLAGA
jgi:hypothetical protein